MNMIYSKQASPFSSFLGGGVGALGGAGLGALTGSVLSKTLGASRDNQEFSLLGGSIAGALGGGLLGALGLGPVIERGLSRQEQQGHEDDLMSAADRVNDSMQADGLSGTLDSEAYRKEFERRFDSMFGENLNADQRAYVQRYMEGKSASVHSGIGFRLLGY